MDKAQRLAEVLEKVSTIAEEVAAPEAEKVDRAPAWTEATMRRLQKEGLMGLVVPEDFGGMGFGFEAVVRTSEVLGRASPSAGLTYGMHNVGSAVIATKATEYQVEKYLRPIARGEHITTLAVSEPGTGSVFYVPETTMRADGDHYVLRGRKSFITNGGHADSYVMNADAGHTAGPGTFSCVVVRNGLEGLEWGEPWTGLGMRGNEARHVALNDVRIPAQDRLGREGDEVWYMFKVVAPYFLAAMAGTYVGIAEHALDETVRIVNARRRDAGAVGSLDRFDVFHYRIGEAWTAHRRAQAFVHEAGARADAGDPDAVPYLMTAKAEATRAAIHVVNECMSLAGGRAYAQNSVLERLLRDARAGPVMAPTEEALYTWAGRAFLGEHLLGR